MKNILEEMWDGNLCPSEECRELTQDMKNVMNFIAEYHDSLMSTLTEKQKRTLEKLDDCYAELTDINEREIFRYAFRLGARIAIEVMSINQK